MTTNSSEPNKNVPRNEVIFTYTQDQAIEDGVLVLVGYAGDQRVVFSRALFEQGYADWAKRKALIEKGFVLLGEAYQEDSPTLRLRVIEKGKIWVIWNAGEGFTFLTPEDY